MLLDISIWAEGGVATGEEETNFLGLPLPLADLLLPPELSLGLFSLPLLLLAITDQWSQEIIRKVYGASQLRVFGYSKPRSCFVPVELFSSYCSLSLMVSGPV